MSDPSSPARGPVDPATDGPAQGSPPQTGEAIPASRRLARPPSDRYRVAPPETVLERPDLGRALMFGLLAGLSTVIVSAIFHAVLSITAGLLAVGILGGWLIGTGVKVGAWSGQPHRASSAPTRLAAVLGLVTWCASLVGSWMLSMAILPGSSRGVLDRLVATPFLDWLAPQFDVMDLVRLVLLVGVAWVSARSTAMERPVDPV